MEAYHFGELGEEALQALVPAYFYVTTRQRNAWWGVQSSQYRGPTSLTCALSEAKEVAEGWRKQGSAFTIQRVPGILVISENGVAVGAVEFHSNNSYSSWDRVGARQLRVGTPLPRVLHALGPGGVWRGAPPSEDSFISARVTERDHVERMGNRASFRAWTSQSYGGSYWLGWTERPGRHEAPGVRRIVRTSKEVSDRV